MLEKQLATLGFSDDEVKTYVQVLEAGSINVGSLSKKVGVPRPTLYYQLERLQERGLINQTLKRGVKTFFVESPQKINLLFQQHISDLQEQQQSFNALLPELEQKIAKRFLKPRFQLYEGLDGLEQVLLDVLLYPNTENLCFWPIKEMIDVLSPEFFHKHNKERIRINSSIRAMWPESSIVDSAQHPALGSGEAFKRDIRIAPQNINFTMGYWIYGNKVAFLSSLKECFGFTIESAELVQMQTAQFEALWAISTPFNNENSQTKKFISDISC